MKANWNHTHAWKYKERGFGLLPKQNTPDQVGFPGHIAQCECEKVMFFADDPKLEPQEIEDETT